MELYPAMPETWKAAESKCRKEVSGMGGYQRHVSGNDGKQMNHTKPWKADESHKAMESR